MEDHIVEELRHHLKDYVQMITKPSPKAGRDKYICPLPGCGSGTGRNGTGAFSVQANGTQWHCFSCNQGGDLFDLIGLLENKPTFIEQAERAAEIFGTAGAYVPPATIIPKPQQERKKAQPGTFKDYVTRCAAAVKKTNYWKSRGFTAATVTRFNLGYDETKGQIVIPYDSNGSYFIRRDVKTPINQTEGRVIYKPPTAVAGEEPVFNAAALAGDQPCFVTESPIDAISIMQAGGAAVAIGGTGSRKLLAQVKATRPRAPLIISLDNDEHGQPAADKLAEELDALGIPYIMAAYSLDKYQGGTKDANDLLRANEGQLMQDIKDNVARAQALEEPAQDLPEQLPEDAAADPKPAFISFNVREYLQGGFDADIGYFKNYKDRKTGFANIDRHLTLYPGLAALGGPASLGKTTFAVNLADNLIEAGETVLYFTLEQGPIEIVTKILARRLYAKDPTTHINNIDIKNGATSAALEAVKREYAAAADRFIIIRCNFTTTAEDIRDFVEEYIKTSGTRPVVFIDYLQLISPPLTFRGDTRTGTDHVVKQLKTMQIDNELLVIMISSFNRSSYDEPVSYEAFKETGMIEFTCDYIWGLQLSILEDDSFFKQSGSIQEAKKKRSDAIHAASQNNPKEVEFVSLKSRNGKQRYKCFFDYDMAFDNFAPDDHSPHDQSAEFIEVKDKKPSPWDVVGDTRKRTR